MAFRYALICALLGCHYVAYGQTTGIGERRAVVEAAAKYAGVRETGNNRGAVVALFMTPFGYGPGTQYCGLFCHRVFTDAKVKHGVKGPAVAANWSVPNSAVVWRFGRAVKDKPPPRSGDLALFTWGGKRVCHIELIVNWPTDGDYCWVIGGNTSNPSGSGQGVFAKKRYKKEMLVVSHIDRWYAG